MSGRSGGDSPSRDAIRFRFGHVMANEFFRGQPDVEIAVSRSALGLPDIIGTLLDIGVGGLKWRCVRLGRSFAHGVVNGPDFTGFGFFRLCNDWPLSRIFCGLYERCAHRTRAV